MKKYILNALVILSLISISYGVDVKLAWDAPTNNTDGSALVDLTGYNVDYVRMAASSVIKSNKVESLYFLPIQTTTVFFASSTNAPVGTVTETNMVNLQSGLYIFTVRAVAATGVESTNSKAVTNRVGKPSTVPLIYIK